MELPDARGGRGEPNRSAPLSGGGENTIAVTADALDAEFARRQPDLHSPEGTPLFVHLEGVWNPVSRRMDGIAPFLLGWRVINSSRGRIAVSIYMADGKMGTAVERMTRSSLAISLTPAALLPGPPSDLGYKRVSPFCISCTIYVDGWQHTEGAISFTQPESQTDRSAFDLS